MTGRTGRRRMSEHPSRAEAALDQPERPWPPPVLLEPERRIDGPAKVTGAARYAADILLPGTLHLAVLGSPVPHGRIRSISAARAAELPGVHAILTGQDVRGLRIGRRLQDQPLLAWDRVRFVGDRIAAVAAESPEMAQAALTAIDVDIEELTPILDPEAALGPDAPILHPEAADYRYLDGERPPIPHPNVQGRIAVERGEADLEAVFARARLVVSGTYRTPRLHSAYLEPHACLAWPEGDRVHLVTTNKAPYSLRRQMAVALGLEPESLVLHASLVGGDFGGKGYSVDEYLCVLLARRTGRPVRAVTSYSDELSRINVRHAAVMRLRTAVDEDGRLLAHEAQIILDGGAYAAAKPLPHLALAGAVATMSAYRVPNVRIEALTVYTNTVPAGHVRAPGEVQALFAGESQLDEIARELGEDPLQFRLRNAVRPGDVGAAGERFREPRAVPVLAAAADAIQWHAPRPPGRGRGIAMGVRHVGGGKLPLRLRLHHDGWIELLTGLPEQGGGAWQVMRRVFAAAASVSEERVRVVSIPTSDGPPDPGVGGSRATHLASRAAAMLGDALRQWLDERLPGALPEAPSTAELRNDAFVDTRAGVVLADFASVVGRLVDPASPTELAVTYDSSAHEAGEPGDYDFAACALEVDVDRGTGEVRIRRAALAVDVGTVINPTAHRGQLEGGFVFGLGGARLEELIVEGGVVTNPSLADFKIPAMADVPPLEIIEVRTRNGPGAFGAKMAGELTNAVVAPALANAVADAIGVRIRNLPISAERVYWALGGPESRGAG
jgi:CO/xanthine dehydrogenase Mo-binding subunit